MGVSEAAAELCSVGKKLEQQNLTWGNAGNISMRTGPDRFVITGSGTMLGELAQHDFVECSLGGELLSGSKKPSKEAVLHGAIYSGRPDINVVIHSHPFYGLLLACSEEEIPRNWFIENMYYNERVARVRYHHPGSRALAEAVRAQSHAANLLILDNHGILAFDVDVSDAFAALETLEVVSQMYVLSRAAHIPIPGLPHDTVREFLEDSGYKPRREWSK